MKMKSITKFAMSLCAALAWSSSALSAPADQVAESYKLEAAANYAGAIAQLQTLVQQNHEFAVLRTGYLLYMQGKFKESIAAYQQAIEINPESVDALNGITLPLLAQLQWKEAASYSNKVLKLSAWDYTAHLRLLISEEAEKKWKIMGDHAREFAKHYPSDATALVYVARAEAWLGNIDKAGEAYRRVMVIVPKHIEATKYLQNNKLAMY